MDFIYDLTTNRGKVRFNLGDTVEDQGPRPDGRNFWDDEIDHLLTEETTVTAATAFGFEILASEWVSFSIAEREDDYNYDAKETANNYANFAKEWRAKPDGGTGSGSLQAGVLTLDFMEKGDD